jgi:uncharacterized protein
VLIEVLDMNVAELKSLLGLQPHPTCGFTAQTYRSARDIPAAALPPAYGGSRPQASVLYFLVTSEIRTAVHRIRSDQMYHHYLGALWK